MLKDKFVLLSLDDVYRTGQIKDASAEFALVQFDDITNTGEPGFFPMELVCLHEMAHATDDGVKVWGVFHTRDELDVFVSWLEGPKSDKTPIKLVPIN
jgi:hypothetical protein